MRKKILFFVIVIIFHSFTKKELYKMLYSLVVTKGFAFRMQSNSAIDQSESSIPGCDTYTILTP